MASSNINDDSSRLPISPSLDSTFNNSSISMPISSSSTTPINDVPIAIPSSIDPPMSSSDTSPVMSSSDSPPRMSNNIATDTHTNVPYIPPVGLSLGLPDMSVDQSLSPSLPVSQSLGLPDLPPPYEEIDAPINAEALNSNANPPSYEEVQQEKALEAGIQYPMPLNTESNANGVQVIHVSPLDAQNGQSDVSEETLLGNDFTFLAAFTGTFVFNWIALILFLCFCNTIAGRTGALAGFGCSSALTVIFRYSHDLDFGRNGWLLWIILILGIMISIRAILQYAAAKRKLRQQRQTGFSFVC